MEYGLSGQNGLNVQQHVVEELDHEQGSVHLLCTVASNVLDLTVYQKHVTQMHALVRCKMSKLSSYVFNHLIIDACRPNPCYRGVTCLNDPNSLHLHRCGPCPVGMTGDGTHCEPVNEVSGIEVYYCLSFYQL